MKVTFTKKQIAELAKLGFKAHISGDNLELSFPIINPLFENLNVWTDGETIGVYCTELEKKTKVVIAIRDYSHSELLMVIAYLSGVKL